MRGHVLAIDDDPDVGRWLVAELTRRDFSVTWKPTALEGFEVVSSADVDVIVTDVDMPGLNGLEFCERMVANRPDVPVVILTALGSMETAIAAIRAGAYDFIPKPPTVDVLVLALERAVQHRFLRDEVKRLRRVVGETRRPFEGLLGASAAMQRVYDRLERIVDSDLPVLISGETGTGKELVARALHRHGRRAGGPFVAVNCAALPETLLESELFGHARGAFTDARAVRTGLFVQARGGVVLLDEIGELPLALQPKLLRAIQERSVRPIGADAEVPCDVRFVAATNRDLESAVAEGRLRDDLYFRLNVLHVDIPPLRARGDDVLLLAQHFLEQEAARSSGRPRGLSPAVAERLLAYPWPGNVRELQSCIAQAVVLAHYDQIVIDDLPERIRSLRRPRFVLRDEPAEIGSLATAEREHVLRVLDQVRGNRQRCAEILRIDPKTLYRKLKQYTPS